VWERKKRGRREGEERESVGEWKRKSKRSVTWRMR